MKYCAEYERSQGTMEPRCKEQCDSCKRTENPVVKEYFTTENNKITKQTNFLNLTSILHQSLVDANLNDKQFGIIWDAINEVYSKLKVY